MPEINSLKKDTPKPTKELVIYYLYKWYSSIKYPSDENSISGLFNKLPDNNNIEEVLLKVRAVNSIDSTRIKDAYSVAEYIVSLKIDKKLKNEYLQLVEDIASVHPTSSGDGYYSFASKYCARHKPNIYPMNDVHVRSMLWHFQKTDSSWRDEFKFEKEHLTKPKYKNKSGESNKLDELEYYIRFEKIIQNFIEHYKLKDKIKKISLREIDIYLWLSGKEYVVKDLKYKAIQCLKRNPGKELATEEIAEWIVYNYPKELIQKLSDKISKDIYKIEKLDSNIKKIENKGIIKLCYKEDN